MFLLRDDFGNVLRHTPLVSIDLIVRDERECVLVGLRRNRPAQGFWFTPGGRIYKDERIDDAFLRITHAELGRALPRSEGTLLGIYEHLYGDNALELHDVSTHYVVLAYQLRVDATSLVLPDSQHGQFRWMSVNEILGDPAVHANTRAYFE